jgi:hypothetical protein
METQSRRVFEVAPGHTDANIIDTPDVDVDTSPDTTTPDTSPNFQLIPGGLKNSKEAVDTSISAHTTYNYDRTLVSTADKVSSFLQKGIEKTNRFAARWARRRTLSQTIDQTGAAIGNAIDNKIDQAAEWTDSKIDIVKAKAESIKETGAHAIETVSFNKDLVKGLFENHRNGAPRRKAARHERWAARAEATKEVTARQAKRMGHAALSATATGVSLATIGTYKAKEVASATSEKARGFIDQSLENHDTPAAMDVLAQRRAARAARLEARAQKLQAQAEALRN